MPLQRSGKRAAAGSGRGGHARPGPDSARRDGPRGGSAPKSSPKPAGKPAGRPEPFRPPLDPPERRRARAEAILSLLRSAFPQAGCALHHRSAYELLVATILSAQCTDERVNRVTPTFFGCYPDVGALAGAAQADVEKLIHSTGFFRNKARSLIGMARLVRDEFGGQIPDTMDGLLRLPGVARKTANCVLGTWFGRNEGIVVDTHVGRVAHRLGLTATARNTKDAEKIERDLMELFPRDAWTYLSHALIELGRGACRARRPECPRCPLGPVCPSAGHLN